VIRLVVLVAVVLAARPAGAECTYTIGGPKPFCPQRGTGYQAPIYRFDIGAVADRIVLSGGDSTIPEGSYATRGGLFRAIGGLFGIYGGGEASFGVFDVPRIGTLRSSEVTAEHGWFGSVLMVAGYRRATGPVSYGLEAAGGLRTSWRAGAMTTGDSDECEECELRGVLDLRAHLGVFWTPFVSTSLQVGASLVRRDEYTAALMIGFSLFPFDGLR
jgi:hypothetical protein